MFGHQIIKKKLRLFYNLTKYNQLFPSILLTKYTWLMSQSWYQDRSRRRQQQSWPCKSCSLITPPAAAVRSWHGPGPAQHCVWCGRHKAEMPARTVLTTLAGLQIGPEPNSGRNPPVMTYLLTHLGSKFGNLRIRSLGNTQAATVFIDGVTLHLREAIKFSR